MKEDEENELVRCDNCGRDVEENDISICDNCADEICCYCGSSSGFCEDCEAELEDEDED